MVVLTHRESCRDVRLRECHRYSQYKFYIQMYQVGAHVVNADVSVNARPK